MALCFIPPEARVPIADHLDILDAYGAAAARVVGVDGEPEDLLAGGGELAQRFEHLGHGPLLGVLRDPRVRSVLLADGELEVQAERHGRDGRLRVSWGEQVVVDQILEIPPAEPVKAQALFRPEPESRVRDLRAALGDPGQPLHAVVELGGEVCWFGDGLHGPGVGARPLLGAVPAIQPGSLGSDAFRQAHGLSLAVVGRFTALVEALAFSGSGGLGLWAPQSLDQQALDAILEGQEAQDLVWAVQLAPGSDSPSLAQQTLEAGARAVLAGESWITAEGRWLLSSELLPSEVPWGVQVSSDHPARLWAALALGADFLLLDQPSVERVEALMRQAAVLARLSLVRTLGLPL